MANTLDPMDLKQIITLHTDDLSNRQIGELLSISRNTVNNYMQLFNAGDHTFEELLKMDNHRLKGRLFNVLNRQNPYLFFYEDNKWQQLSIAPIMPSIRWSKCF